MRRFRGMADMRPPMREGVSPRDGGFESWAGVAAVSSSWLGSAWASASGSLSEASPGSSIAGDDPRDGGASIISSSEASGSGGAAFPTG